MDSKAYIIRRHGGFTVIELIIAVLVIAVLVVTALPRFMDATDEAELTVTEKLASNFSSFEETH